MRQPGGAAVVLVVGWLVGWLVGCLKWENWDGPSLGLLCKIEQKLATPRNRVGTSRFLNEMMVFNTYMDKYISTKESSQNR